jgi:hypothetical protein
MLNVYLLSKCWLQEADPGACPQRAARLLRTHGNAVLNLGRAMRLARFGRNEDIQFLELNEWLPNMQT